MPFSRCTCCENRYGLDGDDLTMIHQGIFGKGLHTSGRPVETRVTLSRESAKELIKDLMYHFNIDATDLL